MKYFGLFLFLDRVIHLYLYYIVMACFLALVPNLNPNYPLFHYIFKFAGFYLIPPIFGVSFSPMILMIILVLLSMGIRKIYVKLFLKNEQKNQTLSDEFIKNIFIEVDDINKNNSEDKEDNGD